MARGSPRRALLVSFTVLVLLSPALTAADGTPRTRVAALGRLEPGERVLDVAAPRGERVARPPLAGPESPETPG